LRKRGDALFAAGDLAPARKFYELAADAGDSQAALQLGESYDPAFLAEAKIAGERGDPATAGYWYQRASKLGAPGAEILLKAVMTNARPPAQ
jgi:TPR repeat protein